MVRSPTIAQLAAATNVPSNNFYAETLIKLLGARFGSPAAPRPVPRWSTQFARSEGSFVHAVDGSGLTRSSKASTAQVARFLQAVRAEPYGEDFIDSLAVAGREGTVADRMHGTAAAGRCRVKTGTLTGVSALSGYCFNRSGRTMIFSILMGGRPQTSASPTSNRTGSPPPSPATEPSSRRPRFVEDLGAELLGLGQLRAGVLAGDRRSRSSSRPS